MRQIISSAHERSKHYLYYWPHLLTLYTQCIMCITTGAEALIFVRDFLEELFLGEGGVVGGIGTF